MTRTWPILLTMLCVPAFGDVTLVKDAKPQAQIVIADKAPRMVKLAATELQQYIEKISGARLPVVTAPQKNVAATVYIGRSAFTDAQGLSAKDFDHGAFRIVSGANWLVLLGRDDDFTPPDTYIGSINGRWEDYRKWDKLTGAKYLSPMGYIWDGFNEKLGVWDQAERGSLNAVYELLRTLGVRWYFPGELGEVTPKLRDITIAKVDKTVRPDYAVRRMFFYYNTFRHDATGEETLWHLRLGLNWGQQYFGSNEFGHGLRNVHGRDKSDPTMFAVYNDKRSTNSHWNMGAPCLSSETLFKATLKYARAVFDIYPNEPSVDISPVDGYGSLCQCKLCRDKGTPHRGWNGRMSDYVWGFMNRVAIELNKSHPGRTVTCLAYSGFQQPPLNIKKLSPNISVILCRWRADFDSPAIQKQFRDLTEDWLKILPSKQLFIWDYYLHSRPDGPTEGVPVFFPQIISDDLKFLKGKSLGDFIEVARNWKDWNKKWHALAANHLNVYVTARLYWDADQDLAALLDDYYTKFYGPASKEMKTFVEYAQANWRAAAKDVKVLDRLVELITAARKAAGNTIYGKRVDMLVKFMEPLRQKRAKIAQGRKGVPKLRAHLSDKADVKIDGKLDETFWKDMASHELKNIVNGGKPAYGTSFKIGYAGDNLYVGIVCHDADTKKLTIGSDKNEDTSIFVGDSIELYLETQTHAFYQIAINPIGALIDLDRKGEDMNMIWSSQAEVRSHIGKKEWTLEIRIPVAGAAQAALNPNAGVSGRRPSSDQPWYFNVCRQRVQGANRELSAFSPTGTNMFAVPMKFAELYAE